MDAAYNQAQRSMLAGGHYEPCVEPLSRDRRFVAQDWQTWPYNMVYQSFLLHQQWWHNATTGVAGVLQAA